MMAKASRCFTGSRMSVGTPTLSRNSYRQLMQKIRKESERVAEAKREAGKIRQAPEAS